MDTSQQILVVVGAHLRAEAFDRASAYALARRMTLGLEARGVASAAEPRVVVCSDLWYLNSDDLRDRPVVSVGGPGVNAFSAYIADRLPSLFVVDGVLMVQGRPGWDEAVASCWGVDHQRTAEAVMVFAERYLDGFLDAALDGAGAGR